MTKCLWIVFLSCAVSVQAVDNVVCSSTTPHSITVDWKKEAGAQLYELVVANSTDKGALQPFGSVTSTTGSATFGHLDPNTLYHVRVRAHFDDHTQMMAGWSNFSRAGSCKTTQSDTRPFKVSRIRRMGGLSATTIGLAWELPNSVQPNFVIQHRLLRNGEGNLWNSHRPSSATSTTLEDLQPDSVHEVRVLEDGIAHDHQTFKTGSPDTMWLEVFRISEHMLTTVDFLANHDSGSLEGDAAFMTVAGGGTSGKSHFFDFESSPRVRYCVEIMKVDLSDIPRTPSGPPSIPTNYSFSEYLSCNGQSAAHTSSSGNTTTPEAWMNYTCLCDNKIDRIIAHQTDDQLKQYCPTTSAAVEPPADMSTMIGNPVGDLDFGMDCQCDAGSIKASEKYTGQMPVCLPIHLHFSPAPAPTPAPTPAYHYGNWYHHPAGAKCPEGENVVGTNGCTWRRDPVSQIVYGHDLVSHGWNISATGSTNEEVFGNAAAMRSAFDALPGQKCCGC